MPYIPGDEKRRRVLGRLRRFAGISRVLVLSNFYRFSENNVK
ncbi:4484_t:CDS:1, partial [Funneliformis geosporum]